MIKNFNKTIDGPHFETPSAINSKTLIAKYDQKKCVYRMKKSLLTPPEVKDCDSCSCQVRNDVECKIDCERRNLDMDCPVDCGNGMCTNQKIRNQSGVDGLTPFQTAEMGLGLMTTKDISRGQYVISYVGEVVTETEYKLRIKNSCHFYGMYLKGGFVVDSQKSGNLSRFINHNCSPNLEVKINYVDLLPIPTLWAIRNIQKGEELSYNYKFECYGDNSFKCLCRAVNCIMLKPNKKTIKPLVVKKKQPKNFKCLVCLARFSTAKLLKQHKVNVHKITFNASDQRITSLTCKKCRKVLANEYKWAVHSRSHSNRRPEVCEICGKNFKLKSHLQRHLKSTHSKK